MWREKHSVAVWGQWASHLEIPQKTKEMTYSLGEGKVLLNITSRPDQKYIKEQKIT